jgi:single-strand DNA-binding protein
MSASCNICILMGRLTRDPDLRYTSGSAAVANFGLAMNRQYTDSKGEKQEDVTFVDVVCWSKTAEACSQYLHKGSPVLVVGRLQQRSWETEDGSKRHKLEVVASSVKFLSSSDARSASTDDKSQCEGAEDEDVPF